MPRPDLAGADPVITAARQVFERVAHPPDESFSHAHAVAVYGSRARRDADPQSDIDILVATSRTSSRAVTEGKISVTFYPRDKLLRLAAAGDLFLLHVISEAQFPYDPKDLQGTLRRSFSYRPSYRREILRAAAVGWFLVRSGYRLDPGLANRRAAWCVRTIVIAEAAEQRRPLFAAGELARFADDPSVLRIIKRKIWTHHSPENLQELARFLRRRGLRESRRIRRFDLDAYIAYFRKTGNTVGLRTSLEGSSRYAEP